MVMDGGVDQGPGQPGPLGSRDFDVRCSGRGGGVGVGGVIGEFGAGERSTLTRVLTSCQFLTPLP